MAPAKNFYPLRTPFFSLSQYNLRKVSHGFDMKNDECFEQLKLKFLTDGWFLKIDQIWFQFLLF